MLPDWNKFDEVQVGRWAKTPPLQIEYWSLDLAYWEQKEARKFMKFVKAMKPKFNLKVCPIQIKTDKNILTGEWRFFSIPTTITYPNAIDTKWYQK